MGAWFSDSREHLVDVSDRRPQPLNSASSQPHILLGITSAQTSVVLKGRVRALRESGFRVTIVSSPGKELDRLVAEEAASAIEIPMARDIRPLRDVMSLVRLWLCLMRVRPDVVEFGTPKIGLLGLLAAVAAGIPRRVYLLRGLKLETARGLKRTVLHTAEQLTMACAQTVLCNSRSLRERSLALRLAPSEKLQMLGEGSSVGVDTARFSPGPQHMRASLGFADEDRVIGFVGRLTRDKGVPELVEAFESILCAELHARLLLIGWWDAAEDAIGASLRARILQHPRITCTGFVVEPAPYYRAMDVLVLPSHREGFPNAVLEASATGLPVVTTLSTGARDAVKPEVTGLLVPPGYPKAIEEAVLRLLKDGALRSRMGAEGRMWVEENYSQERVLALNVRYYQELLESHSERCAVQTSAPNSVSMD
jgi:glycosyltransferase involved in cell wall biosynthesis